MRGAECWTDHRLVRATLQIRIRPPVRKKKPRRRLDLKACRNPNKVTALREQLYAKFESEDDADPSLPRDGPTLTAEWEAIVVVCR